MKLEKPEEREMEKLLDEIPHATSPSQHHDNIITAIHGCNHGHGHGLGHGHGYGHGHGLFGEDEYSNDLSARFSNMNSHDSFSYHGQGCVSPAGSSSSHSGTVSPESLWRPEELSLLSTAFQGMNLSDSGLLRPTAGRVSGDPSLFLDFRHNAVVGIDYINNLYRQMFVNRVGDSMFYTSSSDCVDFVGGNGCNGLLSSVDLFAIENDSFLKQSKKSVIANFNRDVVGYAKSRAIMPDNNLPVEWVRCDPLAPMRYAADLEAFRCKDSLILQPSNRRVGRNCHGNNARNHESSEMENQNSKVNCSASELLKYEKMLEIKEYVYFLAMDQNGCRFLQQKFEEGRHQVDKIFNGVLRHAVDLMVSPFGNYLMQKLLDVCSEEQRMAIVLVLTENPSDFIRICLSTHGTRAVQKLIDTLKTRQQVVLVVSALQPGILDLIRDLNGNHVLQRCLLSLPIDDNKFIFYAAVKHCADIATHRHGCCVLQRCIHHSSGEYRAKLVAEVCANGLLLAQDAFGNYVVQFVLDLKDPLVTANLVCQFEGNFVHLSTQKFSSNVVEKCIKISGEQCKMRIIFELLALPHFEQLLQHPFANYVIQSALENSKGSLHNTLVEAIQPHAAVLKTNPYCKRIFSRAAQKK